MFYILYIIIVIVLYVLYFIYYNNDCFISVVIAGYKFIS